MLQNTSETERTAFDKLNICNSCSLFVADNTTFLVSLPGSGSGLTHNFVKVAGMCGGSRVGGGGGGLFAQM